jgi:hypothetical protein
LLPPSVQSTSRICFSLSNPANKCVGWFKPVLCLMTMWGMGADSRLVFHPALVSHLQYICPRLIFRGLMPRADCDGIGPNEVTAPVYVCTSAVASSTQPQFHHRLALIPRMAESYGSILAMVFYTWHMPATYLKR